MIKQKSLHEVDERFRRLAAEWRSLKVHSSSVEDFVLHPSYLRIIGMGPDVVPFILAELEKEMGHWFPALYAITEADPVPEEDRGNMKKMRDAWLAWGKAQNYRW